MGLLYSPLLLVIVSGALPQTAQGESAVNVTGFLKRSVLLPCNCTHMTEGLKWQKDKTSIYANGSMNKKRNTYTDRITKAPNETNKDCSILLNNIKEEDTGVYRCHFKEGGIYSQNTVILEVKKDLEHGVFTGESAVNVTGFLKRSVLLPCNCTHMTEGLKWQKDKTSIYANGSMNKKRNTYTDRITKAPNETNKDCSILLNNIKEEDTGVYRCHFKEGGIYSQNTVILEVKKDLEHGVFTEPEQGSSQGSSTDHPQLYLMLIIIPVLLLLFGCIWTVLRKQRQKTLELVNQDDTQP